MLKSRSFLGSMLFLTGALATASAGCSTSKGSQHPAVGNVSQSRDLKGSVAEVTNRTQQTFQEMGVKITDSESKKSGAEQNISGKAGPHDVSVEIRDIGDGMSHVSVSAKDGGLQWNQDYARSVLEKIISKS